MHSIQMPENSSTPTSENVSPRFPCGPHPVTGEKVDVVVAEPELAAEVAEAVLVGQPVLEEVLLATLTLLDHLWSMVMF